MSFYGILKNLQCEMPYYVPDQASWMNGTVNGWAAYKVANAVTTHEAWALGAYSYFNRAAVYADNAFETPAVVQSKMRHLFTISLGGNLGGIYNVINATGGVVNAANFSRYVN